jgi:methylglyoxal synthase
VRDSVALSTLALIAHDNKKADLLAWATYNPDTLARFALVATSALVHDPDVRALLRVCNVHNTPVATNVATADLLIAALSGAAPQPAAVRVP